MTGPTFATAATPPAPPPAPPRATRPTARPGQPPDDGAGMRVLVYLRLHWLMILFCGTLLGGAGAAAAWELLASKYESYALLEVSSAPTTLANQNNPQQARTDFSTYVKTTASLIKSEFVLNAALRDIKDLPTIRAQKDPIKYLDEELLVSWQDGSELIRITFKGSEPEDARKIVDAVQKAFMSEVEVKKMSELRAFMRKVEEAQIQVKKTLGDKFPPTPGGVKLAGGVGAVPAPGAGPAPDAPALLPSQVINIIDPRILVSEAVKLRQAVGELPLTIHHWQRRQEVLKEKLDSLEKSPMPKALEEQIDADQQVVSAKLRSINSHREWKIREASGDPNAPGVLELKQIHEADKRRWEELRGEKLKTVGSARKLEEGRVYAKELEEVVRTVQHYEEQLTRAKEQLKLAEKQLVELPMPEKGSPLAPVKFEEKKNDYHPELSDQEVTDSVYRRLLLQHQLIKLEVDSPERVKVRQGASHPTQKDAKKQIMGTAVAGLMGFILMAAGVIGYETVCRRVSSLADVKGAVPAPVVGVIPGAPGAATDRDPVRRAAANEAIDKLRAYVSQTWLARGATTIAVTSPIGDEGKAFAAFGLASSLAQAGYKTLLVDFDLREPALHTYAGVPNSGGVCELLRGETDMRAAVQFLPSGLHLLPAGKWSDDARRSATGEKLEAVLAKMKEPYDCVVIHGHALLTVAESVEVARRCEVVLVCARYRETATPLLKRAAERVATMEIPYSGIVYGGATDGEALC